MYIYVYIYMYIYTYMYVLFIFPCVLTQRNTTADVMCRERAYREGEPMASVSGVPLTQTLAQHPVAFHARSVSGSCSQFKPLI